MSLFPSAVNCDKSLFDPLSSASHRHERKSHLFASLNRAIFSIMPTEHDAPLTAAGRTDEVVAQPIVKDEELDHPQEGNNNVPTASLHPPEKEKAAGPPLVHNPKSEDEPSAASAGLVDTSSLEDTNKTKKSHSTSVDGITTSSKSKSDGPTPTFPEVLYQIVSDPTTDDICSWLPHGRGFVIHDKNRFGVEILPRYFDGTKYTSFTRRLKRWSFTRIARGPELGAYYNEYFTRDTPDAVLRMKYRVVHGEIVGAAAATMASGGTTHAAAAAAMAAAAMLDGKKKRGRKGEMMKDGSLMLPHAMMAAGFPPQQQQNQNPWNNPAFGNNMMSPMNMMQQQYFHMMMAQQFAHAQQQQADAFQNFMNGQGFNMEGDGNNNINDPQDQGGDNTNETTGQVPPHQQPFQGNFFGSYFPPYPMMGMPNMMCGPTNSMMMSPPKNDGQFQQGDHQQEQQGQNEHEQQDQEQNTSATPHENE